jgi:hypothetical protein
MCRFDFPTPLCYGVGMADIQSDKATLLEPSKLIGTWRRFGVFGPVYEIIGASKELTGGDQHMRVIQEACRRLMRISPTRLPALGSIVCRAAFTRPHRRTLRTCSGRSWR